MFAPTDKAFKKVPAETLESLGEDPEALKRVLLYHAVAGRYPAARVVKADSLKTLAGPRVRVRTRGSTVRVGGAKVIQADVKASNGVIHAINAVLLPPSVTMSRPGIRGTFAVPGCPATQRFQDPPAASRALPPPTPGGRFAP